MSLINFFLIKKLKRRVGIEITAKVKNTEAVYIID